MAEKPKRDSNDAAMSTKQKAAAARAEAEAARKRRETMVRIIAVLAVAVVAGGLVLIGYMGSQKKKEAAAPPQPDAAAASPTGADPETYGIKYGKGWTAANASKLPTLELWEDFQCPACKQLEAAAGEHIVAAADAGKVKLMWRVATFLDPRFPESKNSSARAGAAWGCAVDAGKVPGYHSGVFAIQPEKEGTGYTEEQLLKVGQDQGITGADYTTFEKCVKDGKYMKWTANSQQKFEDAKIPGTPNAILNGKELDAALVADQAKFDKAVSDATAK